MTETGEGVATETAVVNTPDFTGSPLVDEPEAVVPTEGGGGQQDAEPEGGEKTEKEPLEKDLDDMKPRTKKRFDELTSTIKDLKAKIETLVKAPEKSKTSEPDFLDEIQNVDAEDLRDQFDEDPGAFLKKYGDALTARVERASESKVESKSFEAKVGETMSSFAKANEGFDDLWDAGKIHEYMDEHPGSGPDGAYYALTKESREKATQEKLEQVRKDERAKVLKEIETGRASGSLPAGRSASPASSDFVDQLKNPAKHGMTSTQALAADLKAYRASKRGG